MVQVANEGGGGTTTTTEKETTAVPENTQPPTGWTPNTPTYETPQVIPPPTTPVNAFPENTQPPPGWTPNTPTYETPQVIPPPTTPTNAFPENTQPPPGWIPNEITYGQQPTGTTGIGEIITLPDNTQLYKYQLDALPKEYREIALSKGYNAVLEEVKKNIEKFNNENVLLPDGRYINIEDFNKLPDKYKSIAINDGYGTMILAMEKDKADFELNNIKLTDGKYISVNEFNILPDKYKSIAVQFGGDEMQKAIVTDTANYNAAMVKLQEAGAITSEGNIDVAKYLRANPTDSTTLYAVLGDDKDEVKDAIDKAEAYNALPFNLNDYQDIYFKDRGWSKILPNFMDKDYTEKMTLMEQRLEEMRQTYKDKYGEGAFYGSIAATPASFIFQPARALAPDVTVKDISGMEWAVGGAQLATLAVPIVGGLGRAGAVTAMGITGGSTGIFASDIIMRRSEMNKAMLGLSAAGLVLPFIPEIRNLFRGAINRVRPSILTGESIGLTADVGRVQVPSGMSNLAARQLVEDAEILNLKGIIAANELRGLKGIKDVSNASITHLPNGTVDIKLLSADGNVIGHVSGSQRVFADTLYHATPNSDAIVKQIKEKGYFEVESGTGDKPALFTSPQGAQTFAYDIEGGSPSPGIIAIKVLPEDIKPLPMKVRDSPTLGEIRNKFHAMANSGELEPGIYALYKGYGKPTTLEYELVAAPGTKFYPAKSTWYAKGEVPKTGTTSLLNYTGAGKQVSVGDVLPTYWVTTDLAKAAGKGVPSITDMYAAKIYGDLTTIRQYAPWNLRLRKSISKEETGLSTNSPLRSAIEQLNLTPTPVDWSAGRMTGLITNPEGNVLLVRQLGQERYDLPGGSATRRLLKNQSPESSVARELYEEVGIEPQNIQHTDSFNGKFNSYDKDTRQFHIFEGITKQKPNPGAEIADYVWWDGKSKLEYPVADFAKDAIKRSGTKQTQADVIITKTIIQDAMDRAKARVIKTIQDERGSIGFEELQKDARYQRALEEELTKTSDNVHTDAYQVVKQADDDGYLPFKYKSNIKGFYEPLVESQSFTQYEQDKLVTTKDYPDITETKSVIIDDIRLSDIKEEVPDSIKIDDSLIMGKFDLDIIEPKIEEVTPYTASNEPKMEDIPDNKPFEPLPDIIPPEPLPDTIPDEPPPTEPPPEYPPEEPPPDEPPPIPPPPPPTDEIPMGLIKKNKEYDEQIKKIKPGTLVWVQGRPLARDGEMRAMYKVLPPPYRQEDMFTLRSPPPGYTDEGFEGKGSAFKSLQIIGGNPPTNVENIDLGFVFIDITLENGKPKISYAHDEDANVGLRQNTIGMGEGQIPLQEWKEAKARGLSKSDLVRQRQFKVQPEISTEPLVETVDETDLEPVSAVTASIVRPKRTSRKNWWDDPMYNNEVAYSGRYYRGTRLIPPNIGGNI